MLHGIVDCPVEVIDARVRFLGGAVRGVGAAVEILCERERPRRGRGLDRACFPSSATMRAALTPTRRLVHARPVGASGDPFDAVVD